MAEEPRPLMYEVGVEGDRFHPHLKTVSCAARGCIPVTPLPDEAKDAMRGNFLLALQTYAVPSFLMARALFPKLLF